MAADRAALQTGQEEARVRLIFDLDGTLIESLPSLAAACNALLAELGRAPLDPAVIQTHVGHGMARLVAGVIDASGGAASLDPAACRRRFREIYAADPVTGAHVFESVPQVLAGLSSTGHGLAVCTQKPDLPTGLLLHGLGLMPPVAGFIGGDTLDVLKPDPRMFHAAADLLPPGPAVMIGDSETDARTARAAGVPFIFFTGGYSAGGVAALAPDAVFSHYRELPGIISRL